MPTISSKFQGGEPFAAGLDHILDPIGDGDVVFAVERWATSPVCRKPSAPEILRGALVLEVSLGQPGGADDDFTDRCPVFFDIVHLFVDQAHLHQGHGPSCFAPHFYFLVGIEMSWLTWAMSGSDRFQTCRSR
jgi:hypothetical protein